MATPLFTRRLAELCDESDGIVTRQQLFAQYFDHNDVQDGIVRGLLVPVLRGTYAVSRRSLTPRMLDRIATVHFAPAMIVGRSAAERRGLLKLRPGIVQIATTKRRTAGAVRTLLPMSHDDKPGLIAYRPAVVIRPTILDGLPFASMTRMLTDIATSEPAWMLERSWKQADYLKLLDLAEVRRDLDASHRPGSPEVEALLEKHPGRRQLQPGQATPTEFDFLQLIIDAGLPLPTVNEPLMIGKVRCVGDYYWEDLALVAELDDPSHDRPL
ncbi:MAG: hypothetical protein Q7T55_22845, partial [Solirubrobacteraceae bacterium]|nr:hypothetical protein [Solirubrobacteraceae bacterium]